MRGLAMMIEQLGADAVRMRMRGELDMEHAYTFDEELRRVEATEPRCIVLDLRGLWFMDSCGLSRLIAAHRRSRRAQRRLLLVRGSAAVQRLLALTAVDETFEMVSELPESLQPQPAAAA